MSGSGGVMLQLFLQVLLKDLGWGEEIHFTLLRRPGEGAYTQMQVWGIATSVYLYGMSGNPNNPLINEILRHVAIFLPRTVRTGEAIPPYTHVDRNASQVIEKKIRDVEQSNGIKVLYVLAWYDPHGGEEGLSFTQIFAPPVSTANYKYAYMWVCGLLTKIHLYLPSDFPDVELQSVMQHVIAYTVKALEQPNRGLVFGRIYTS
jgi:hypothetical protein